MKKGIVLIGLMILVNNWLHAQQRVVAECTITYAIKPDETIVDKDLLASLRASIQTVYIKGNNSRLDLQSPSFSQSTFFDKSNGTAVVLKEFGNNKFMTQIDSGSWRKKNIKLEGAHLLVSNEIKTILGYDCKRSTLQLKDGTVYSLYFATEIVPSVKEFAYQFKDIPGLVLDYEVQAADGKKIRYTATKINLNPVPAAKFELPTSGYRLLNE